MDIRPAIPDTGKSFAAGAIVVTTFLFTALGLLTGLIVGWRLGRQSKLINQLLGELYCSRCEAALYAEAREEWPADGRPEDPT